MTAGSDVRAFERAAATNGGPGFRRILLARRSSKRPAGFGGGPQAFCYNPGLVDSGASLQIRYVTGQVIQIDWFDGGARADHV